MTSNAPVLFTAPIIMLPKMNSIGSAGYWLMIYSMESGTNAWTCGDRRISICRPMNANAAATQALEPMNRLPSEPSMA